MTSPRLLGKVCIVTGSSSGLGRAIALAYSQEGGLIVCVDLKPEAREEVPGELVANTDELIREQPGGGQAIFVQVDVSKSDDWEKLVKRSVDVYGRVDVLVNNAGISIEAGRAPLRLHETPDETWDVTMAVNTKSVFLRCCYAASKAAVSNLTRQVALDYAAEKIHCNAICPGYTKTAIFENMMKHLHSVDVIEAQHPLRGIGTPDDIIGAAMFLASGEAAWITGVCLPVDGGYTAQ